MIQPLILLSRTLAIPTPALPKHHNSAFALREFSLFLVEDPECAAAALASRYSAGHAALYQFGAVLGYASVYRRLAPGIGAVFTAEIEVYGSAAGLPQELWRPWLQKSLPPPQGNDPNQAVSAALRQIDNYIRNTTATKLISARYARNLLRAGGEHRSSGPALWVDARQFCV